MQAVREPAAKMVPLLQKQGDNLLQKRKRPTSVAVAITSSPRRCSSQYPSRDSWLALTKTSGKASATQSLLLAQRPATKIQSRNHGPPLVSGSFLSLASFQSRRPLEYESGELRNVGDRNQLSPDRAQTHCLQTKQLQQESLRWTPHACAFPAGRRPLCWEGLGALLCFYTRTLARHAHLQARARSPPFQPSRKTGRRGHRKPGQSFSTQ